MLSAENRHANRIWAEWTAELVGICGIARGGGFASLLVFTSLKGVVLYSKPNHADELMGYVETLSKLVGALQRDAGSVDLSDPPAEFRRLTLISLLSSGPGLA